MKDNYRIFPLIEKLITIRHGEWRPLLYSFIYHFSLLCGFYIIRPLRDEMGIAGGVEKLQWMFTGTFLVMLAAVPLFGWLTRNYSRKTFMPSVYIFFIICLLSFYALFKSGFAQEYTARAFFIWASVFNLFIVSVFWSFMADIFSAEQSKRVFGLIAAGGTAGALSGPAITALLVLKIGTFNLLLISAFFLAVSIFCIWRLTRNRNTSREDPAADNPDEIVMGGTILASVRLVAHSPYLMGICLFMILFTTLSTFIYFNQAYIIRSSFSDPAERTALFAVIDLSVNALTLMLQVFLTGRIVGHLGVGRTLAAVPFFLIFGFMALAFRSSIGILAAIQIIRRAGDYAVTKPAREMLYVVLNREEKYKAKNFIDTVIYRGGDALSAWLYAGLTGIGMSINAISAAGIPLAALWVWLSVRIGNRYNTISGSDKTEVHDND